MKFEKLTEKHLKELYDIRFSVLENLPHEHQIKYLMRENVLSDINQGGGWICSLGKEYIGYGLGIYTPEPIIGGLFVRPEFHRKGIGSGLLTLVTKWFKDQGVNDITLTTDKHSSARKFYINQGWTPLGMDEFGQLILKKESKHEENYSLCDYHDLQ